MKNVLMQLRPQDLEDIIAVLSLYRPGPMESIPRYIENRHHPDRITYKPPLLEPILKVTCGCIIYQEQVMQIFRSLAGYSLGRADIVRRAMSKKKKSVMEQERKIFIYGLTDDDGSVLVEGCVKRGIPEETAKEIFAEMESFASYAFNKSHAASYSLISYQTAYLKCHYPCQYFAALLTSVLNNSGKVAIYIDDCSRHGISVIPPHVNSSEAGFTVDGSMIRFGLLAVKNLGRSLIDRIIRERRNGRFRSFYDFCRRMYGIELNRRALESLIRCGALDDLGANRKQMLLSADVFLDTVAAERDTGVEGQLDLFGMVSGGSTEPKLPAVDEYPVSELLEMEKASAGIYLTGHPLSEYDSVINAVHADRINEILENENNTYYDGKKADIFAVIGSCRLKTTKNGQQMAFVQIEDKYGSMEMIVFPKTLAEYGGLLREGSILRIGGVIQSREDEDRKLICNTLQTAPKTITRNDNGSGQDEGTENAAQARRAAGEGGKQSGKKPLAPGLYLRIPNDKCTEYIRAKQLIDIFDGSFPLHVYFTDTKILRHMPPSMSVDPNYVLIRELKKHLSPENVAIVD